MPYRAFPERVGPRILLLESVDYFGTIDYFSGRKKNNLNKNALTAVVSLAFLEIRSRDEEAINSTRYRIYSLKVLTLLTSILFTCF